MNRHVPPHDLDRREAASFGPRAAPDFRRAARHSARVRFFRIVLPLSLVAAVVVLGAIAFLSSFQLKIDLPFEVGRLSLSGSRLTMEEPKLSGFTEDNRGYNVTAKTASQDLGHPDVVDLADIEARLEMADKGWAKVEAKTGSFNVKSQFITLGDGVDLAMNGGYGGHLKDADVDVKAGTIKTDKPVVFTYLDGKLVADKLTVSDRGQKALFEGNVQLDFRLSDLKSEPKPAAPVAAPVALGGAMPQPLVPGAVPDLGAAQAFAPAAATPAPAASPAAPASNAAVALPPAPLPPRRPAGVQ